MNTFEDIVIDDQENKTKNLLENSKEKKKGNSLEESVIETI